MQEPDEPVDVGFAEVVVLVVVLDVVLAVLVVLVALVVLVVDVLDVVIRDVVVVLWVLVLVLLVVGEPPPPPLWRMPFLIALSKRPFAIAVRPRTSANNNFSGRERTRAHHKPGRRPRA